MNSKGFSIIELLVVIFIITLLTSIGFISISKYLKNSYRATAMSNARNCLTIVHAALLENETPNVPQNCQINNDFTSCTCTVEGFAGSVTCTLEEGGIVECN